MGKKKKKKENNFYLSANAAVFRQRCHSKYGAQEHHLNKNLDAHSACCPSAPLPLFFSSFFHLRSLFLHTISEMRSTCRAVLQHRSLLSSPCSLSIKVRAAFEVEPCAWALRAAGAAPAPLPRLLCHAGHSPRPALVLAVFSHHLSTQSEPTGGPAAPSGSGYNLVAISRPRSEGSPERWPLGSPKLPPVVSMCFPKAPQGLCIIWTSALFCDDVTGKQWI